MTAEPLSLVVRTFHPSRASSNQLTWLADTSDDRKPKDALWQNLQCRSVINQYDILILLSLISCVYPTHVYATNYTIGWYSLVLQHDGSRRVVTAPMFWRLLTASGSSCSWNMDTIIKRFCSALVSVWMCRFCVRCSVRWLDIRHIFITLVPAHRP